MSWMFVGCKSLDKVDLSSFDTRNVIDISNMFTDCKKLVMVNILSFETKDVIYMYSLFTSRGSLVKIVIKRKNYIKCTKLKNGLGKLESKLIIIEV